jgi:GTP-binding protein
MLSRSKVAIIGRPNVGKSTLFNILTGQRRSVVKNQPGVTRDLIFGESEAFGREFDLIDTGGLTESEDVFSKLIKESVTEFLDTVDVAIVVMDARAGLIPEDRELIKIISEKDLPAVLVCNKIDRADEQDILVAEFYEFGLDVIPASLEQRRGLGDLMEWLSQNVQETEPKEELDPEDSFKIAILGKPNVGKSSMFNRLVGEERVLVSDVAGTTIDSIDTVLKIGEDQYTFIDTAGLRKQRKRIEGLEKISAVMSEKSLEKADLVFLVIDAREGPTDQDARILQAIQENHKGVIVIANKADVAKEEVEAFRKKFRAQIEARFHFFKDVSVVFTSAKTGSGFEKMFSELKAYRDKLQIRIPTRELNEFFTNVIRQAPAPLYGTKTVKFYYLTQTKQMPPSFIAFANHPDGVNDSYRRFLINRIKENWKLDGVPIRIFAMKSRSR